MLVFEKEVIEWSKPHLYRVDSIKEEPLPLEELARLASATLADGFIRFMWAAGADT